MKGKIEPKKLLIIAAIIIAIIAVLFICVKLLSKEKKATAEQSEIAATAIDTYISSLTEGYDTPYGGKDLLFQETYNKDNISNGMILMSAIRYATANGMDTSVSSFVLKQLEGEKEYPDISNYIGYNAEAINEAIYQLFGLKINNLESINEAGFGYNIYYNDIHNMYVVGINSSYKAKESKNIEYSIIKSTTTKDTIKTEIAIDYTSSNKEEKIYYSDPEQKNEIKVSEIEDEFPKESIKSFDKYIVTLEKNDDNYIFKSIEKES